jgi:glycerol-3-phosphate O-acyltransferase
MDKQSTMSQAEILELVTTCYQKMLDNYHSTENLVITPKNVFQEGIRHNYSIFMESVDKLMLPGSCVVGAEYLMNTLSLINQKKSILFLMKHIGNFDVPCFYSLLSKEGEQYRQILDRLVFIAGRKLNEDSLMVKTFSEIFSRLVIVPNREIPTQTDHETPEQKSYRETIENEAAPINRAAFRKMINLKKEGRIIVLFPMGGRPKPWLKEKGVKETTSYMRIFDYVQFIKMEGNLLPVGREMTEEQPQQDKIVFTISDAVIAKDYLEESRRLFEEQTEEMDFDQFNLDRLMVEIGQIEGLSDH